MTLPPAGRPTPRPDVRLDDGAMAPVTCGTCSARVEVRKSSWEQTSIQWTAAAADQCLNRRAWATARGPNGGTFPGCSALQTAVSDAAVRGELPVQIDDALPVNPEAH